MHTEQILEITDVDPGGTKINHLHFQV